MPEDLLPELDRMLASGDLAGGLDFLIERFRETDNFALVFEARLMKKRLELGLPMIQIKDSSAFPPETRAEYDQAMIEAAREVGGLFLAAGNIERAWPYFRAIGEPAPVAEVIERAEPGENLEAIVAIAFHEGVNPAKGLALILTQHGMCRALTTFGMYAVQKDRDKCIELLVRGLHAEIVERIGHAIEAREGSKPDSASIPELIAERDWLFGEYDYYVDTSHLVSILPYCIEVSDMSTLRLYRELCEYGKRLSQQFQSPGQPPFANTYVDYGEYVQATLGIEPDERIAHFQKIVESTDPQEVGTAPAEVLVNLLVRLGRHQQALEASLKYLGGSGHSGDACPSALRICELAGDYGRMKELARERGDLLSYVAASR